MKVLLLGGSGMLGTQLNMVLRFLGHEVTSPSHADLSLTDPDIKDKLLEFKNHHYLVNCAAKTDVNSCESGDCLINYNLGGLVSTKHGMHVVQISTDYVFDGRLPGFYKETDLPNPINEYGKSKLRGEMELLNGNSPVTIIRTSWLFSESPKCYPAKFLKFITSSEFSSEKRVLASLRTGTPTHTLKLAHSIVDGLEKGFNKKEIYHLAGNEKLSYKGFLSAIAAAYAKQTGVPSNYFTDTLVEVDDRVGADLPKIPNRPSNTALNSSKWVDHGFKGIKDLNSDIEALLLYKNG